MIKKLLIAVAIFSIGGTAYAARWQIEISNVTPGQTFTPVLAVNHYGGVHLFEPGAQASDELAILAESGNTGPLTAKLESMGRRVAGAQTVLGPMEGLLGPGQSVSFEVHGRPGQRLSLAAMLIPTNDTIIAIDSVFLPVYGTKTVQALAYDAGSEPNDQNCANIPGPRCGGRAISAPSADDEGFVHVSNGFHDLGDAEGILEPAHYGWNNPVALVSIRRVH